MEKVLMTPEKILLSLLRCAVCGEQASDAVKAACTPENLEQVYTLANKHDLAHIPGQLLAAMGLPESDALKKLKSAAFAAVHRYVQLDYELKRICDTLQLAQIPYVPLKGAVIREFYPEPWMRTSCDIDILVHEADLERAAQALTEKLSYTTDGQKKYHDMWLFSPSGIHLELHFSILETMENMDALLCRVWEFATPETEYCYQLSPEFLAFHLLAHTSYHFTGGGSGIRSMLDIFLLRRQKAYDETALRKLLAQCGLETFYDAVLALIAYWFEGETPSPVTEKMSQFVLNGGTYGTKKQNVLIKQQHKGGKVKYLLTRLFPPYKELKFRYRVLEKHPILYPVMLVRRWVELMLGKRLKESVQEAKIALNTAKDQSADMEDFLRQIGL
ncbi:MAG: nucleotidyltransferase family protein [Oscillospiraceae bacterium]|nr:nucleotidyltransferase family protein [Oscillospiraceae bacterium]